MLVARDSKWFDFWYHEKMTETKTLNEDDIFAQRWPLHALCREYAQGSRLDDDAWLSELKALLDAGHDPGAFTEGGLTPFDLLSPAGNAPYKNAPHGASLLIEHGYNPFIVHEDGPISGAYLLVEGIQGTPDEMIALAMIRTLIETDASAPKRSIDGGNILHVTVDADPDNIPALLEWETSTGQRTDIPPQWLDMPDKLGRRPLDLIWGAGGKWDKAITLEPPSYKDSTYALLDATRSMIDAGADIFTSHPDKPALIHTIASAVKASQKAERYLQGTPLLSTLDQYQLDTSTHQAIKQRHARTRL